MNIAIVSIVLKDFCRPFLSDLESYYPTPNDKLCAVRNAASDQDNKEVVEICDWIEKQGLIETFFPK